MYSADRLALVTSYGHIEYDLYVSFIAHIHTYRYTNMPYSLIYFLKVGMHVTTLDESYGLPLGFVIKSAYYE